MKLDYKEALGLFKYYQETGVVEWRNPSKRHSTNVVGHLHPQGYLTFQLRRRTYQVHRVAWLLTFGEWPKGHIDHINWVKSDNRLVNLRDVTQSINLKNQRVKRNNTSGVPGVCFNKTAGKWNATVYVNGKRRSLGYFHNKDDAIVARRAAEKVNGYHKVEALDAVRDVSERLSMALTPHVEG